MPLLPDEAIGWHPTEIALEEALCEFCNDASDAYEPVDQWNEGVQARFRDLRKAYNDWYSWRKGE